MPKPVYPTCHITHCNMRAIYTAIPMTEGEGDFNWNDHESKLGPVPACRSHLTSVITWMSEYNSHFHIRTIH